MTTGPTCSACPLTDPGWPASTDWKAARSSHARPSLRNAGLRSTAHLRELTHVVPGGRAQAIQNVIAHAQRISHDCERRIYGRARREEAAIDHIQVVEVVRLTIHIQRRGLGIVPEADGAVLV